MRAASTRSRLPDLHLGDDRPAEGRHGRARQPRGDARLAWSSGSAWAPTTVCRSSRAPLSTSRCSRPSRLCSPAAPSRSSVRSRSSTPRASWPPSTRATRLHGVPALLRRVAMEGAAEAGERGPRALRGVALGAGGRRCGASRSPGAAPRGFPVGGGRRPLWADRGDDHLRGLAGGAWPRPRSASPIGRPLAGVELLVMDRALRGARPSPWACRASCGSAARGSPAATSAARS